MKKPDKLEAFFQTAVALVGERLKSKPKKPWDPHIINSEFTSRAVKHPEATCWQGSCECNGNGHWYSLYELVKRFWRNAPEVDADWEGEAKLHLWDPDALHELLVGAFLGEKPKAKPSEKPDEQIRWKGKPLVGVPQMIVETLGRMHQMGIVDTEHAREVLAPYLPPEERPKGVHSGTSVSGHVTIPLGSEDARLTPNTPINLSKTSNATATPPVNVPVKPPPPTLTPGQKAARRRWEWENEW